MKKDIKKKRLSKGMKLKLKKKINPDVTLSPKERKEVEKSLEEYRQGKFTPLSKVRKELGWRDDI